jgi:type II secretory pathway pseudopilin PulG
MKITPYEKQLIHRVKFSLVELLVVISIFAILISILQPVLKKLNDSGYRISCLNNMKNIYSGTISYGEDFNNKTPLITYSNFNTELIANSGAEFAEQYLGQKVAKYSAYSTWAQMGEAKNCFVCPAGDTAQQGYYGRNLGSPWNLRYTNYSFTGFALARYNGTGFEYYRSTDLRVLNGETALLMDLACAIPTEPSYVANAQYAQNHGSRPGFFPDGINCIFGDGAARWLPLSELRVPNLYAGNLRPKAYGIQGYVNGAEGSTSCFFTPTGSSSSFSAMNQILW